MVLKPPHICCFLLVEAVQGVGLGGLEWCIPAAQLLLRTALLGALPPVVDAPLGTRHSHKLRIWSLSSRPPHLACSSAAHCAVPHALRHSPCDAVRAAALRRVCSVGELTELAFADADLVPLLVAENYANHRPDIVPPGNLVLVSGSSRQLSGVWHAAACFPDWPWVLLSHVCCLR